MYMCIYVFTYVFMYVFIYVFIYLYFPYLSLRNEECLSIEKERKRKKKKKNLIEKSNSILNNATGGVD